MLDVGDICFSYASRAILQEICFSVQAGQVMAILGNNGAGKTTLLKCLARSLKVRRGTALLETQDILRSGLDWFARQVGYMAQRQEPSRLTVFDAVLVGRKPYVRFDYTGRDLEIARQALQALGMEQFALRYLDELSGGELQKVAIARLLAQEPRLLLLDEPTSNLDLRYQYETLQLIKRIARQRRLAVVATLHDLNQALRFADRFLFIQNGRIVACGDQEIITPQLIEDVYGIKVQVHNVAACRVVVPVDLAG